MAISAYRLSERGRGRRGPGSDPWRSRWYDTTRRFAFLRIWCGNYILLKSEPSFMAGVLLWSSAFSLNNPLCLTVKGAGTANNSLLLQYTCNLGLNQGWNI